MRSLPEKNLKITFFTDAPFIVKFRFEKYRYLLTYLLCIQIFEAPLSDSHSTGPRNVSAAFNCHCSSECVREGFTKKSCFSFGFCPNEGGPFLNFLSHFHKFIFVQYKESKIPLEVLILVEIFAFWLCFF